MTKIECRVWKGLVGFSDREKGIEKEWGNEGTVRKNLEGKSECD